MAIAHDDGGGELPPRVRGSERQPQRRRRRADRDDHGERDPQGVVAQFDGPPHGRHAGVVHAGNGDTHEDAAEDEAGARYARATDNVEAAARGQDRQHEGKDGQADIVGHRHRQHEGEHGDEVHRPYAASQGERGRREPDAVRGSLGQRHVSAEIQGRVRREASDQDGQGNEVRIVCSGNDHGIASIS